MKTAKEIYKLIEESELSKDEQNELHDWYCLAHTEVSEKALSKLEKVKQWRERKVEKLQNKVLRRIR